MGFKVTPPGEYLSTSRVIKGKQITKGAAAGHYEFVVSFSNGLIDQETTKLVKTPFLDKKISTVPYDLKDESGQAVLNADGTKKQGSSVASYLAAFAVNTKGMTLQQVRDALMETQSQAVVAGVGRTDTAKQLSSPGPDGSLWSRLNLKTKDFIVDRDPINQQPIYTDELVLGGVAYKAKAVVSYFKKSA